MRSLSICSAVFALLLAVPVSVLAGAPAPGRLASPDQAPAGLNPSFETGPPGVAVIQLPNARPDTVQRLWIGSICAMVAASAFDAASSWGKQEANPLLASRDRTFGGRGLAIKAAIAGAVLLPQILLHKHKRLRKSFMFANFADAAVFTAVSIHNLGISRE
ncbi:MAG TPA: hypothetical protein VF283_21735 [Bryobacteraceae bacterium]